jgi:hypothetical protein
MLIGGFDLEKNNERFHKTKESAKNLMKTFIVLRQNSDKLSTKDSEEISVALNECFNKLIQIVQRIRKDHVGA